MANKLSLPSRRLVSQADQSMIARPDVPRSVFHNRWSHRKTFDQGSLYPFLVDEILPGDHMRYRISPYVRMATAFVPVMDSLRIDTHIFFVPNRLTWANWVRFMGEQDTPTSPSPSAYSIPQVTSPAGGFPVDSLFDHMELPTVGQTAGGASLSVSALPPRAYSRICFDWFRDENLNDWGTPIVNDGPNVSTSFPIRRRAKSHDYFTSCLPWPQKFTAPAALGTQAPVIGLGVPSPNAAVAGGLTVGTVAPTQPGGLFTPAFQTVAQLVAASSAAGNSPLEVYADLSAVTVNVLRQSFMVQALLERDARGGTRYTEIVRSHFGVISPDARLQRSEYIGGGSTPLNITPVAQTVGDGSAPVGYLGGVGTAFGSHAASYSATEHGYIIGVISVKAELSYSQGVARHWSRRAREEFYFPTLAGLGEQAVLRKEIYATGSPANDDAVFGYQARFEEYRQRPSAVVGLFRPTSAGNIDQWHLSQQFLVAPTLGATFIGDEAPMSRVLVSGAQEAQKQFLADIVIERTATRPIPVFGTPATFGRF